MRDTDLEDTTCAAARGLAVSFVVALTPGDRDLHVLRLRFRWAIIITAFSLCGYALSDDPRRPAAVLGAIASAITVLVALAYSPGERPWWERPDVNQG